MSLSIKEACALLGISRATAYRLQKSGQLAERIAQAPRQEHDVPVNANYDEPATDTVARPTPCGEVPTPESFQPRPLSTIEQKQLDDLEFAEKYKAGLAFDSSGNSISTTTIRPRPRPKRQHNEHMNPALLGRTDVPRNPVDSDDSTERWHPGTSAVREKMYADSGERQPTEQERKATLDHAAIAAAFRHGYSR